MSGPTIFFALGELVLMGSLASLVYRIAYRKGRWHGLCERDIDMRIERYRADIKRRDAFGRWTQKRN